MYPIFERLFRAPYGVPNGVQTTADGLWIADQISDRVALVQMTAPSEYRVTPLLREILIMAWPGRIPAGQRCDRVVSALDVTGWDPDAIIRRMTDLRADNAILKPWAQNVRPPEPYLWHLRPEMNRLDSM